MKVLVVAPHPDDEVLGCGGTIHRLASEGAEVTVAIVTKGWEPLFSHVMVEQGRREARVANDLLGVKELRFLDLPVTRLNEMARHEINAVFGRLVDDLEPEWILLPFSGDRHVDHRQVFEAAMVAVRPLPRQRQLKRVLCYETVSETHWSAPGLEQAFDPQLWVSIGEAGLTAKLEAMKVYESQCQSAPNARSLEAIDALARFRGSVIGVNAAEAFVVVRECL